ncbi:hypothetical protein AgCh_021089 [Apium graveolens]
MFPDARRCIFPMVVRCHLSPSVDQFPTPPPSSRSQAQSPGSGTFLDRQQNKKERPRFPGLGAQVIHRSDETWKAAFSSVNSETFFQSGKVFGDNTWRYQKAKDCTVSRNTGGGGSGSGGQQNQQNPSGGVFALTANQVAPGLKIRPDIEPVESTMKFLLPRHSD